MFGLKPHKINPDMQSEYRKFAVRKNTYWTVNEMYKSKYLCFNKWKKDKEEDINTYILIKTIHVPLSFHSFYIMFIYPHLGKCHPDLRSKFYIGKPIEKQNLNRRNK